MGDWVRCHGLKLQVEVGFHPWERETTQTVEVDLSIETSFRVGPERDERTGLVDYEQLIYQLERFVQGRRFDLIEALAVELAREILRTHPSSKARVRVTKKPMGLPQVSSVNVECERTIHDFEPR